MVVKLLSVFDVQGITEVSSHKGMRCTSTPPWCSV